MMPPTTPSSVLPIAIGIAVTTLPDTVFATNAPRATAGHILTPKRRMSATATPEAGHTGDASLLMVASSRPKLGRGKIHERADSHDQRIGHDR